MKPVSKRRWVLAVVFAVGLGFGGVGGFVVNDLSERTTPESVEEMCEQYQTQDQLEDIFARFHQVMTVELNYSDSPDDPLITSENRRYGQLATLLRLRTLLDVDCWSAVSGQPMPPGVIAAELERRLEVLEDRGALEAQPQEKEAACSA